MLKNDRKGALLWFISFQFTTGIFTPINHSRIIQLFYLNGIISSRNSLVSKVKKYLPKWRDTFMGLTTHKKCGTWDWQENISRQIVQSICI